LDGIDYSEAVELTDALQQPLTAACNYIGAARILIGSDNADSSALATKRLEEAEIQILRAGDIVRRFQRTALKHSPKD